MKSDPEATYRATLNDLKAWFDEEGMSHDKPIHFSTGSGGACLAVASTYKGPDGTLYVDLEGLAGED